MSDNNNDEFAKPDPLDQATGNGNGDFIPESTMLPESGLMFPEDNGNGPDVMDGDSAIPESFSTVAEELPGDKKESSGSALKKNMPFIVFGLLATAIVGSVGFKMMDGSGNPQQAQPAQQPAAQVAKADPVPPVEAAPPVAPPAPMAAASAPEVAPAPEAAASEPSKMNATAPVSTAAIASAAAAPVAAATPADDLYSTRGMNVPKEAPAAPTKEVMLSGSSGNAAQCAPVAPVPKCDAVTEKPVKKAKVAKNSSAPKTQKVAKSKKKPEPLPSTEGYEVHMGANGLAWVTLPGGERRVVTVGDRIEGLGVISKIDAANHLIVVGRVTLR